MSSNVVILGLPGTGKTTFVAALYVALNHAAHDAVFDLKCSPSNATYFERIAEQYTAFKEVGHTPTTEFEIGTLQVRHRSSQELFEIHIPDLSGEAIDALWTARNADDNLFQLMQDATVGLIFVRPDPRRTPTIAEADEILNALGESSDDIGDIVTNKDMAIETTISEYDPGRASDDVKMVEIVQILTEEANSRRLQLFVIISAWDLVQNRNADVQPIEHLRQEFPLFCQFLESNPELFESSVLGLSAFGCDPADDTAIDTLSGQRPEKRCTLIMPDGKMTHDLSNLLALFLRENL